MCEIYGGVKVERYIIDAFISVGVVECSNPLHNSQKPSLDHYYISKASWGTCDFSLKKE